MSLGNSNEARENSHDRIVFETCHLVGVNIVKIERVLFLQPQPCVRALKYARALKQALDGKISLVFGHLYHTLNALYGYGDETFDRLTKLRIDNLESDIRQLVESHRPQVIHSHNAPDLLTVSAIEAVGNAVPIIHDNHEALSLRRTGYYATDDCMKILEEYPRQEKKANEGSDGRIHVTEYVKKYIQQKYDVDPEKDIVFLNYVSESVVPQRLKQKLSVTDGETHVVYVGAVTSRIEGCYYDLREIFREIANHKVHVHLYVSLFGLEDKAYVSEEITLLEKLGIIKTSYERGKRGIRKVCELAVGKIIINLKQEDTGRAQQTP